MEVVAAKYAWRPHIMVVDDALDVRETLGALLEAHGFRVSLASDGLQAIGKLKAVVPDLIIVDQDMPNLNGWELIRRIRQAPAWSHLPAILNSGNPSDASCEEAWFDAALDKPSSADEMVGLIKGLLSERNA